MEKRRIEQGDIQKLELDILIRLLKYFEENGISYCTSGGTTLGSIRHKGFIPWDDDIDIYIPRPDYNRLLEISDCKLIDGYISIKKPGDKNYIYSYAKACNEQTLIYEKNVNNSKYAIGVFVDLFPLDKHYNSYLKNSFVIFRLHWYLNMLSAATNQNNLSQKGGLKYCIKQAVRMLQKPAAKKIGAEAIAKRIDSFGRRTEKLNSRYVGNMVFKSGRRDYYDISYFSEFIDGEFEGHKIKNPKGYDKYLTEMYGDYMKLPPKEKRIAHAFDAWYID